MPQIDSIKIRRGTAAAWVSANPTLESGEYGLETDTRRIKIGDGITAYTSLAYITRAVAKKTANYTLAIADRGVLADATAGAFTISLPTAASAKDVEFFVKKIDISGNTVIIDGNGAETIDGQTTQIISEQYTAITIYSDGTEWHIL